MKIAAAQLNFTIGDFHNNTQKIIKSIKKAKNDNADLIVFSELAICGYPPRDLLNYNDFIDNCIKHIHIVASYCQGIAAIVGGISINKEFLFNTAFFLNYGKIEKKFYKTLLPNYDIFDESRYFAENKNFNLLYFKNKKIAITICEDIWNIDNKKYNICPLEMLNETPDIIINISASPFSKNHYKERKDIILRHIEKYKCPFLYVNQVGANTDLIFDGGSIFANANNFIEMKYFKEDYKVFSLFDTKTKNYYIEKKTSTYKKIKNALILGIKDYFKKNAFKKAVVGVSGGIDSAVTLSLSVEALGSKNIVALIMPSMYSSKSSISDAKKLCENLNCKYYIININKVYNDILKDMFPVFDNTDFDVTEENLQARIRALYLMAYANKSSAILLNTSNKSELATGYGTLYGDMTGALSILGDLYKTEVYKLAKEINLPEYFIKKTPSAELRPNQKDSDTLPEYEILDKILYLYIDKELSKKEILKEIKNTEIVEQVISLVNKNEYKRYQAPPVLRISNKAFGLGRRIPLVAKYEYL